MNYAQVFRTPYVAEPRVWGCSYCGRERGPGYTCDGCGAPSVLVPQPAPPLPLSLPWWRERIAAEPPPVPMEFTVEGRFPWPFLRIFEDPAMPPDAIEVRSSIDRVRVTGLAP